MRTPGRAGANAGPCWCARTSPGLGEADRQALAAAVPALRGLADSLREEAAP
uniref:hypothetical protein n=1 Tax=Nonomuraea pusilla TaxID=46177 RepID=UPI001F37C73C|nr:hypothetical protein [Nonomuraea pusilla]